jgi:putative ABC transport system ATP-binding protein
MPLVECTDICKNYKLGTTVVPALRSVNVNIERGDFVAIWGPSGSGKTSLLNLIGLLDTPSSGQIKIAGEAIGAQDDSSLATLRNKLIGFIFQNFNLVPVLSALENVMLPLQIRGESPAQARNKAALKLDAVGLSAQHKARPDQMSGGQRQRVAIARALVTEPAIILADEPTANLDSVTSGQILSLMRDLNRKQNVTFIFSTHDPRLLETVTRKIGLQDGQVAPQEVGSVLSDYRTS